MKKTITKLLSSKDTKDKSNKNCSADETFGSYICKYCQYVTAQKWILDKHISSVHDKICSCPKFFSKCNSNDVLKDPYR